jgi:hypothetical protein
VVASCYPRSRPEKEELWKPKPQHKTMRYDEGTSTPATENKEKRDLALTTKGNKVSAQRDNKRLIALQSSTAYQNFL